MQDPEFDRWRHVLLNTTVRVVMEDSTRRRVVAIGADEPISLLLSLLLSENLLSLPVVASDPPRPVVGFVDVLDVACLVLDYYTRNAVSIEDLTNPSTQSTFFATPVKIALNYSGIDLALTISEDASLYQALRTFSNPNLERRIHRVGVVNSKNELVGILSQSDIISFVLKYKSFVPRALAESNVHSLGMYSPPIIVRVDTPFVEALEKLTKHKIHGLALFDNEYHLTASLSVSDLRGIVPNSFEFFNGSALQFLCRGTKDNRQGPVITCSVQDSFMDIVQMLTEQRLHRIFVTDSFGHPVGVITLGDVISKLI
jgi:CBS-domain-containing membrane protein